MAFAKISSIKTAADFVKHCRESGISIPFAEDMSPASLASAKPFDFEGRKIGNRFCVLPMEGWDCEPDGKPGEHTIHRWKNFGLSGAKLIWGGEAAAVRRDGRSNPAQLMIRKETAGAIAEMRGELVAAHKNAFGKTDDLFIGLQLTHSGRFSKPNDHGRYESKIVYRHPVLDRKFKLPADYPVLTDTEIDDIIADYVSAAKLSLEAGFDFVDVKHCHGYLGHEFLSAVDRSGRYGGSFENRTRFFKTIVEGIKRDAPGLAIGVRLSIFDFVPFKKGPDNTGVPEDFERPYKFAFGGDGSGTGIDMTETLKFLDLAASLGVRLVYTTAGSPYYNPHIQRPAMFPPCDGYLPPEDPLKGCERQIHAAAKLKKDRPGMIFAGTGFTYLQEWFPNVAEGALREGMADFIGLGRMMLPYPDIFADILAGRKLRKEKICRTFSDCTTAPRNGIVSGCYPLDCHYKNLPEFERLKDFKKTFAVKR
jgi:2,4-dienoyl-CoA reductase-like NADH-dependent reductase (Old Yellow Enzyme family)